MHPRGDETVPLQIGRYYETRSGTLVRVVREFRSAQTYPAMDERGKVDLERPFPLHCFEGVNEEREPFRWLPSGRALWAWKGGVWSAPIEGVCASDIHAPVNDAEIDEEEEIPLTPVMKTWEFTETVALHLRVQAFDLDEAMSAINAMLSEQELSSMLIPHIEKSVKRLKKREVLASLTVLSLAHVDGDEPPEEVEG